LPGSLPRSPAILPQERSARSTSTTSSSAEYGLTIDDGDDPSNETTGGPVSSQAAGMYKCTECALNVHWMFTECSLNVHWRFTEGSLNVPKCTLHDGDNLSNGTTGGPVSSQAPGMYTLTFTEYLLNVHWMFTECSLNVHWIFAECTLNVHWMFYLTIDDDDDLSNETTSGPISSQAAGMYTLTFTEYLLNVPWMFTECALNVHWMFTKCSILQSTKAMTRPTRLQVGPFRHKHQVCIPSHSLNICWMFTECSLNVHWMYPECSLNVHWMFAEWELTIGDGDDPSNRITFGPISSLAAGVYTLMCTECSLNVHWMFTECSLNVHWMFTECSLNVLSYDWRWWWPVQSDCKWAHFVTNSRYL
jgi:hypothetical protein